jgi:beta-mannosidase
MDLGGTWSAASPDEELRRLLTSPEQSDVDSDRWQPIEVPGHWQSHPTFRSATGPFLYRRRFDHPTPETGRRFFLTFDGIFYQGDVWLDSEYVGDTEGYFFPHTFEITEALAARTEHLLTVEVSCQPPEERTSKRNLTGIFQHWDCIDPDWNPGGIWAPVHVDQTGPVRIRSLKLLCPDANAETATLDLEAELDTVEATSVTVRTAARLQGADTFDAEATDEHTLAAGRNRVRWRLTVERPLLWWPHALGAQPLYDVDVEVATADRVSDQRHLVTGLRQVRLRNFVATVNGERLFLKGANHGPTQRALADASPERLAGDVVLAKEAGLDLLRVHAHITRREFYEAADRHGMLVWQDLPLQWGYGQVRRQAVAQAREAVTLLGHHPSVAIWCGHNEPLAIDLPPGNAMPARTLARILAGYALPTWNKSILDRSIRRSLERSDGTREVVAHSGIFPHPAWGTDSHLYYGWYHGHERDFPAALARLPVLARFVSEFGAQAVPDEAGFMDPDRWPDLDWERLEAHHALQRAIFEERVPPGNWPTFDGWRKATQDYQATVLRYHIETLRRLKYRPTGGFCLFLLADAQPAVTWSVLDHERRPKAGYAAVAAACAPVIITVTRPATNYRPGERLTLDVHAISDLRRPLEAAEARVALRWSGGGHTWRYGGDIPADSCVRIGRLDHTLPTPVAPGPLTIEAELVWADGSVTNTYESRVG